MTENDNDRVRTPDEYAVLHAKPLERLRNATSARIMAELGLVWHSCEWKAGYHTDQPVGVGQGPQVSPMSSEMASCNPCPPYIATPDPASNTALTERRGECSTSPDKKLLTRRTRLLQEEAATKDENRAGAEGSASQGIARTILRLLGGNDSRSDVANDEQ